MVKLNKAKIISICKEINKKEGEGSVYPLGSSKANLKIKRWSSGIEDMDFITGNGFPEGRIIEVFGPEASGKTSFGYHLMSRHSLGLYIPIEGTFDSDRAKVFGNRPKQMLVYRANYGESALNKTMKFAEAGIPIIIIDSVPACIPKSERSKKRKDVGDANVIGGVAKLFSETLPELVDVIEFTGTTVVLINQVRDKLNAMMFGEKTDTPGGRAIKFYSSLRIQVARRAWIEVPNKEVQNTAKTKKVGMIMKAKVVKSKICNPMGETEIPMFFDRGFTSFDDIKPIREEMMNGNKRRNKK